ncbi:hypothetical protein H206_05558 [Candidatus Electrothrix aarhusensis]|uniref:Uncharacterized protein n=1 Tax=Candidatus Electrothrix aarhusensis TaxID=1859131 RepID=A0A3S3RA59_9BACT|nr:hypothetical protein H206_05558 [Candidatus Electrothrix aarhusensis]
MPVSFVTVHSPQLHLDHFESNCLNFCFENQNIGRASEQLRFLQFPYQYQYHS